MDLLRAIFLIIIFSVSTGLSISQEIAYHGGEINQSEVKGPEKGWLLIIGGGRLDSVFYSIVMEKAGGAEAPLVIIPTASTDEALERDPGYKNLKKRFTDRGFKNVHVMHTRDTMIADSEDFARVIRSAKAIWFGGGRQWRIFDAYTGTKSEEAFHEVLEKGGIIAGTSAGATIQGSYLARGDSKGNTTMMGDHEKGFNFITNVAIDQHVLARNRQFDIFEILKEKPSLLGIGLDENTGILVQGNAFEVVGSSYVLMYDGTKWNAKSETYDKVGIENKPFHFMKRGQRYDLINRRVVKEKP
jgi:cyanophycinase